MKACKIKTLDTLSFKGKKVFLRVDLNSEIIKNKPVMSKRIQEHGKTIAELKRKGARVIIVAHQSRKGKKDFTSLKGHARLLNRVTKVTFINESMGKKAAKAIAKVKNGEAILLENIRYLKDETNPPTKNQILLFFKDKIDVYVNDAFSIAHRNHTSIALLPKVVKERAAGRVFMKEYNHIKKLNTKDTLFILGGNKIEDLMLLANKKQILATGLFAVLCLKAKGYVFGSDQTKILKPFVSYLKILKRKHIEMPEDLAFNVHGKRKEMRVGELPSKYVALDIGMKTIEQYERKIQKAKKILWKGTAGDCSKKAFCMGTKRLLKAIEKAKAFTVIAGGHSLTAAKRLNINQKKLGYSSLSGGALLYYIAGKKLPGLEALHQ